MRNPPLRVSRKRRVGGEMINARHMLRRATGALGLLGVSMAQMYIFIASLARPPVRSTHLPTPTDYAANALRAAEMPHLSNV